MVLLVFEHLEQDLSDLIERLPKSGMPPTTIQVMHIKEIVINN